MMPAVIPCQTILHAVDGGGRCPTEATHIVAGLPGQHWFGYHCDEHTKQMVLSYDHQGGCVVRTIPR